MMRSRSHSTDSRFLTPSQENSDLNENSPELNLDPESVWNYPRPPAVEHVPQRIRVVLNGQTIVDTQLAKRVLETSHPPVYYIPPQAVRAGVLLPSARVSWCEWKGQASYYDVRVGDRTAAEGAWYYPDPTPEFAAIKGYIAFYAHKMDACYVADQLVVAQGGGFYGGWITPNISGPFKGGPGTKGW
jgi:uncharacterized protein (DUF427 family)